jgi:hypothetical protein
LRRGDAVEVSFAFNCWLARGQFSVSLAVHSRDGVSYDWLDGALFFQVTSPALIEGVANLNASATARRLELRNEEQTGVRGDGATGREGASPSSVGPSPPLSVSPSEEPAIRNPNSAIEESLTHG